MADSTDHRPNRLRRALAAGLTVLVLLPIGILFAQGWQRNTAERADTELEQQGMDYLTVLIPLVSALATAQSSAMRDAGTDTQRGLATAADAVAQVDQSVGLKLRVHERWAGLQTQIKALAVRSPDVDTRFQDYVEATDLALALCAAVRTNSGLIRDQANDVSYLQQAVAVDLPGTIVQVSRMSDLALLLKGAPATRQSALGPQFFAAAEQQESLVADLTDSLQSAVDDTGSTTLSGRLVDPLNQFRRGAETLSRAAGAEPNAATIAGGQTRLQSALGALSGVILTETAGLLEDRADRLETARITLLALAVAAVLMVVAALVLSRAARSPRAGSERARPDPVVGPAEPARREPHDALR